MKTRFFEAFRVEQLREEGVHRGYESREPDFVTRARESRLKLQWSGAFACQKGDAVGIRVNRGLF